MTNAAFVNVLDTRDQLLVHSHCSLLVQPLMRHDVVKELTVLAEFHNQEELAFGFNDFKQLYNIGMPHLLKYLDLPTDPLDVLLVFDPRFLQYLNGHFLVG